MREGQLMRRLVLATATVIAGVQSVGPAYWICSAAAAATPSEEQQTLHLLMLRPAVDRCCGRHGRELSAECMTCKHSRREAMGDVCDRAIAPPCAAAAFVHEFQVDESSNRHWRVSRAACA